MRLYFSEDSGFKARIDEIVVVRFTPTRAYIMQETISNQKSQKAFPCREQEEQAPKIATPQ